MTDLPQLDPYRLATLAVIIGIMCLKHLKPIRLKRDSKLRITLVQVVSKLEMFARLILYVVAVIVGLQTIYLISTMPDTTVEVPVKVLLTFLGLVALMMVMMLASWIKAHEAEMVRHDRED